MQLWRVLFLGISMHIIDRSDPQVAKEGSNLTTFGSLTNFHGGEDPLSRTFPSLGTRLDLGHQLLAHRLETHLIGSPKTGLTTDMSKVSAVTRHQAVTTTLNRGNQLEKSQEVFEEMSKLLARK